MEDLKKQQAGLQGTYTVALVQHVVLSVSEETSHKSKSPHDARARHVASSRVSFVDIDFF